MRTPVASALSSDSGPVLTNRTGVCRLNVTSCCVVPLTVFPWLLAQPRTSLRSFLPPQGPILHRTWLLRGSSPLGVWQLAAGFFPSSPVEGSPSFRLLHPAQDQARGNQFSSCQVAHSAAANTGSEVLGARCLAFASPAPQRPASSHSHPFSTFPPVCNHMAF